MIVIFELWKTIFYKSSNGFFRDPIFAILECLMIESLLPLNSRDIYFDNWLASYRKTKLSHLIPQPNTNSLSSAVFSFHTFSLRIC